MASKRRRIKFYVWLISMSWHITGRLVWGGGLLHAYLTLGVGYGSSVSWLNHLYTDKIPCPEQEDGLIVVWFWCAMQ